MVNTNFTQLGKKLSMWESRCMKSAEYRKEHTKKLPPLWVGFLIWIQNQIGPNPTKWNKTWVVTEVRQFDQYIIKIDGSGRVTHRNRKFLRLCVPIYQKKVPISDFNRKYLPLIEPFTDFKDITKTPIVPITHPPTHQEENAGTALRRSSCAWKAPAFYTAS